MASPTDIPSAPSRGLRIWHALNGVLVLSLLGTVLLRKTLLSAKANAALLVSQAQEAGSALDPALAKTLAKAVRDRMWEWHPVLGQILCAVLVLRGVLFLAEGMTDCPFRGGLQALARLGATKGIERMQTMRLAGVRLSHAGFYLSAAFMAATGALLRYSDALGVGKGTSEVIAELHENAMWLIVAFVAFHVIGVIQSEFGPGRGLISNMIHGREPKRY
jgi:cytochrome b561